MANDLEEEIEFTPEVQEQLAKYANEAVPKESPRERQGRLYSSIKDLVKGTFHYLRNFREIHGW